MNIYRQPRMLLLNLALEERLEEHHRDTRRRGFDRTRSNQSRRPERQESIHCRGSGCPDQPGDVGLYMQMRQADNCEIRSDWFEDVGGSAALNMWGRSHLIIGNRFIGNEKLRAAPAGGTTSAAKAITFTSEYSRGENACIIGNVMDTGAIEIGSYWPNTDPRATSRRSTTTSGNNTGTVLLDPNWQIGTTFNEDNEPYVVATKPAPTDVGLNAPDPLCGA